MGLPPLSGDTFTATECSKSEEYISISTDEELESSDSEWDDYIKKETPKTIQVRLLTMAYA